MPATAWDNYFLVMLCAWLLVLPVLYAGDVGFFVTAGQLLSYLVWKVLAQSALWGMTVLQV